MAVPEWWERGGREAGLWGHWRVQLPVWGQPWRFWLVIQRWGSGYSLCGHPVFILDRFQDTWSITVFPSSEEVCTAPLAQSDLNPSYYGCRLHSLPWPSIGASHPRLPGSACRLQSLHVVPPTGPYYVQTEGHTVCPRLVSAHGAFAPCRQAQGSRAEQRNVNLRGLRSQAGASCQKQPLPAPWAGQLVLQKLISP